MQDDGPISLPPPRNSPTCHRRSPFTAASAPQPRITGTRRDLKALHLRRVTAYSESRLWNEVIARYHYLGQDLTVRNRKQRHTARRIYERLVEEHGFRGGERTVRRLVAAVKEEIGASSKDVFLPLEFYYGQLFEADWFEADIEMGLSW